MRQPLFEDHPYVSNEDVIKRMEYLNEKALKGMKVAETDKESGLNLAKEIREILKKEHHSNDLNKINNTYKNHELFSSCYKPAVHEALASITGKLTKNNYESFLYDVHDYMQWYLRMNT